jgi:antagonist of KipI
MSFTVIKPGAFTTVRDLGRTGYQHWGVPVSGVMDGFAHKLANTLVGNPIAHATLETTLIGPVLLAESDMTVCIAGADVTVTADDAALPLWSAQRIAKGSLLRFGAMRSGCRAYLAVAGGFEVPLIMGSRSTLLKNGLGRFQGRALQAGDVLPVGTHPLSAIDAGKVLRQLSPYALHAIYEQRPLRLIPSRYFDEFPRESKEQLWCREFRVGLHSDRMGYRLEGPAIMSPSEFSRRSEAVALGTVQVMPQGQLIVLMADRQTVGGYPTIGTIAAGDHAMLAQCATGARLRFLPCEPEEARQALDRMETFLSRAAVWAR